MRHLLLLTIIALTGPAHAEPVIGRASVIDADTIEITGVHFRLFGVDAVEARQQCWRDGERWPCGRRAAFALADHLGSRPVTCTPTGRTSWKRLVARCRLGTEDLAAWLAQEGWAVAVPAYSTDDVADEEAARLSGKGTWAWPFTIPAECRKEPRRC